MDNIKNVEIENLENAAGKESSKRGFASMSPSRQREIASKGGKAAHRRGVAHKWNSEEARAAGKKGGATISKDREHMSEIGRKGGATPHTAKTTKP